MQEYSKINRQKYEKIRRLVYNLRKRYQGRSDLYIGAIAMQAGRKLIRNYYRTHKSDIKSLDLIAYIVNNLSEFQEELDIYLLNFNDLMSNNIEKCKDFTNRYSNLRG